jgi:2-aminoadipate transaminase
MPRIKPGGWEDLFATRTRGDVGEGLGSILALSTATDLISFSGGFPDPATFPGPVLAEILKRLIAARDASAMQYAPTPGLPGPRAFIAERLEQLEGRGPEEGEFLITSGAIEALELLSKTFLDPGDLVLVEGPTYLGAIMAFRSFQANVECLPIDQDGLDTEALERRLAAGRVPKLLYTIPDHQNPAGLSLSADRRRALVELGRRYGFLLVEDVAYRELGFAGERLPSLWSLAPDTVVQVGTFSKTFFPGSGWGGARGRPRSWPSWSWPSRTPISALAPWVSAFSRSTAGRGFSRSRMPVAGLCTAGDARSSSRPSRHTCPKASPGPGLWEDSSVG